MLYFLETFFVRYKKRLLLFFKYHTRTSFLVPVASDTYVHLPRLRLTARRASGRLARLERSLLLLAQEHDGDGRKEQRKLHREITHGVLEKGHVEVNSARHDHGEHKRTLRRLGPQRRVTDDFKRTDNLGKLVPIRRRASHRVRNFQRRQRPLLTRTY